MFNYLGFWAITRDHSIGEVPGSVDMVPISLPELPKTSRTPGKKATTYISEPYVSYKISEKKHIFLIFLLKGPIRGNFCLPPTACSRTPSLKNRAV